MNGEQRIGRGGAAANRANELFDEALKLGSVEERAAFLVRVCGGDETLRERVERLLAAHDRAGAFLGEPLADERGTIAVQPISEEAPGTHIGRYKLLERIGEGGCGVVYVAEQTEPVRRRVALKVIKLGMDNRQVMARFEAERQALAMMDHPNIAKVLDAGGTDTGRPYFVMELVRGIRITEYCDQNNLSIPERLDLFIKVCQAIQHAHQKGIIHRDIKPSNILVTLHDGVPVPKVIDFGIAKATESRLTDATVYTQLHQFIGTPAYMSPEQAEMSGLDIDTRSDIYGLGVLLYELLTGRTPFDQKELVEAGLDRMRRMIREQEPVRPSTRFSSLQGEELTTTARRRSADAPRLIHVLRGDLDWIVMKCLEKDRTRRYETANGLAADLKRHLTNEPVVARPPSTLYRVQKTVRRNKLVFAAGAIVASAIITGFVVSAWSFLKEREARRLAVRAEQKAETALQHEASLRQRAVESSVAAEKAARETRLALADADFQQALRLLEENKSRNALAYLARSLSLAPTNAVATRLANLLANRSWMAPTIVATNSSLAAFSPDGKQVATADLDGFVRVRDSTSGEEILKPLFFGDQMAGLAYSSDGKYLVARSPMKAQSWDAETGREFAVSAPFPGQMTAADSSKDEKMSALGFSDGTVWLLESATLKLISDKIRYTHSIQFLRFSRDGTKLLTIDDENTAEVWDVRTVTPLTQSLKQGSDYVRRGDLSPDCSKVATVDLAAVKIWDLSSGTVAATFVHTNPVSAIEFGPDGKQLLTASGDGTARLSDAATGSIVRLLSHDSAVLSAQFSPDGQWVLTTCADESAYLWDARTGRRITEPLSHAGSWGFFSPDGLRIATVSAQKVVRLWDFAGAPQLPESFVSAPNSADAARFSPDGKRVAVAHHDGTIRFYDAASARPLSTSLSSRIGGLLFWIMFSPDGSRLVAYHNSRPAEIWDVNTGKMLAESIPHSSSLAPCFSQDGSRLLTWSISNSARVWDARTGKPVGAPLQHKDYVTYAEFSPDGRLVVTVSEDRTMRVWLTETGEPLGPSIVVRDTSRGNGLARFSPDGERIATTDGHVLQIWERKTGRLLPITIRHVQWINSVEFSRDGRRILTASTDGSARIWDAASGQPLAPPMNHAGPVSLASFSPDGSRVFTSSFDPAFRWDALRFWDALTARTLADPLPFLPAVHPQFSPDGLRLLIQSPAGPLIWDLPPSESPVPDWLPSLAEAIAGTSLEPRSPIPDSSRALAALKARLQDAPENVWTLWGRWLLADPRERTVSPLSKMPFASGIEHVLALDAPDFLERLTLLARGDNELTHRIEQARNRAAQRNRANDLFREFRRLQALGREAESLATLREAADLGMAIAQNELAYRLASSKDDKIRDGKTALEYALKAVEFSQRRRANILDTLAAAYAEVGDFAKAIAVEEEALGLPEFEWEHNTLISHLELFKAGKPIREE